MNLLNFALIPSILLAAMPLFASRADGVERAKTQLLTPASAVDTLPDELKLAEASCKAGTKEACFWLGNRFVEQSEDLKAIDVFRLGCNAKDFDSCSNLVFLLTRQGKTVEANMVNRKACQEGSFPACLNK